MPNYAKYSITIDATLAATLAANLPNAALLSAGHTQTQIDLLKAELQRAATALRESTSPSDQKTGNWPNWMAQHGYLQKYK